jgi:hypothetical protein
MLRNVNGGPLTGDDGDLGEPTINVKNIDDGPSGPRGGSGPHLRSKRCAVTCIDMIEKK